MKKLIALILAAVMVLSVVACGAGDRNRPEHNQEKPDRIIVEENSGTDTEEPQPTPQPTPEPTPRPVEEPAGHTGIRPEFKAAMDSYEEFFDDYISFMNRYSEADSASVMSLLADYAKYMTDFAKAMEDMETLETEDMSDEEALYYSEVTLRISQKLMSVAQ